MGLLYSLRRALSSEIMARRGLQPRGVYRFSRDGHKFEVKNALTLAVPNLVGSFHNILRQYWDCHGLGSRVLLVSEPRRVALSMGKYYPKSTFLTSDLFPELMGNGQESRPDYLWDVCAPAPRDIGCFDSVIAHAMLEHTIDPTSAIRNMLHLLAPGGYLYWLTATPSFHIHRYPRDYVRFTHDYFEDLPAFFRSSSGIHGVTLNIELVDMWSSEGIVQGCYQMAR